MHARSGWAATAVGTAVGTGGWILGLGKILSADHPQWALFFLTIAVTIVTGAIVERRLGNPAGRS